MTQQWQKYPPIKAKRIQTAKVCLIDTQIREMFHLIFKK